MMTMMTMVMTIENNVGWRFTNLLMRAERQRYKVRASPARRPSPKFCAFPHFISIAILQYYSQFVAQMLEDISGPVQVPVGFVSHFGHSKIFVDS